MTRQVTEGQPITVVIRSREGAFVPDTELEIDGDVYADPGLSERHEELRANGSGEFTFYANAGSVITITPSDPIAADVEPIQVVGVASRPGGVAAVHPDDTPQVHEDSPVSELVSDASLVGAVHPDDRLPEEEGGAAAMVGVDAAQANPPVPAEDGQVTGADTPSGDGASDPDATVPPAVNPDQETPQYEPVADPGDTHMEPTAGASENG